MVEVIMPPTIGAAIGFITSEQMPGLSIGQIREKEHPAHRSRSSW